MTRGLLKEILSSKKTVYSFKELLLLFQEIDAEALKSRINYYIKQGDLYHIRRGFYAKDKHYNRFELATKIMTPSYISFETVLNTAGVIFQYYNQIFVASYRTRDILCDDQVYTYRTIQQSILTHSAGIEIKENYSIASVERAYLDILYLNKTYYFDNLSPLNWDKVFEILPIYDNKRMNKLVEQYYNSLERKAR